MKTLVLVETENGQITDATLRVISAASQRGMPVDLLVQDTRVAELAARITGIEQVRIVAQEPAGVVPETLAGLADAYSLIIAAHRTLGRSALPRAAARVGGAFLSDLIAVLGPSQFVRGRYAGSVLSTVTTIAKTTFATIRASSWQPASFGEHAAPIAELPVLR